MAGLSKSRLERLYRHLSQHVEHQHMPGLVAPVSKPPRVLTDFWTLVYAAAD
jgi:hypothetical protein